VKSQLAELGRVAEIMSKSEESKLLNYLKELVNDDDRKIVSALIVGPGGAEKVT